MAQELTWKKAIDKVLAESKTPLHYKEITERIVAQGLRTHVGATPAMTVNSQISTAINKDKQNSPYVRVSEGIFTLREEARQTHAPGVVAVAAKLTPDVDASDESEPQYDIITSFGMFWRREAVDWTAMPRLLGVQQLGATPVDFCQQLGIYLIYDGREVIYVGRSTERPLGKRLYEHTSDRMSARWDRFSWFGLLPVADTGKLGALPKTFEAAKLIPALEAILIEALEPRQNRKRGDDLAAVEYIQHMDPAVEKRRLLATIQSALDKP